MPSRKEVKLQIGSVYIQSGATGWKCNTCIGDDYADIDTSLQDYAAGDGAYFTNTRFQPRYVIFDLESTVAYSEIGATEISLRSFLNSKQDGVLTITKDGLTRIGYGRIASVKNLKKKWTEKSRVLITFVMPDPWFYSAENTATFVGAVATIVNSGHETAGFTTTLTAGAAVVNPKITSQTGAYVEVLETLAANDVVVISTAPKNKYVTLNGVSCRYNINSDFFELARGSNAVTVSAASGYADITKLLKWRERYGG